jgi:hypothetical protein
VTVFGSVTVEPQCGSGVNKASEVPQPTSQISNESSSGTSGVPDVPSALPSGQGSSIHDLRMPLGTPQLQVEEPQGTHHGGTNQAPNEIVLEEVVPEKGPMTGGKHIIMLGENFPATPLYAAFGDKWVRVVSCT